ncbi:cytochrome P450 [Colletotrichum tofieldiae]|nr:cytochrome P450 [Colletotrichum tofieldiae]
MGWGKTLTFLPFGPRWQMHRKLLQTTFSNTNVRQWYTLQVTEARRSIHNVVQNPENWEMSMKRFAVAIVLKVSYGIDVPEDNDPYVKIAEDAMYATGNGGVPANSIVDIFPLARGKDSPSFAHTLLETYTSNTKRGLDNQWSLDDIKGAAGAIFIAGADTTWATIVVFVLNMVLNPEVQKKAQASIDRVVGHDRLPNLSDRPSLQYIDHVVQEVYR